MRAPLLLALLVLSTLASVSLSQTGVLRKMADAPWPERAESSAYHNALPQSILSSSGTRMLVPPGSMWVYGGMDISDSAYSDVWVTTDSAKTWHEVSGISPDMVVQDASRSADCYDHRTGRVYAITGSDMETHSRTARIVASYDGQHWEIINHDAGFPMRERPGCTVDSQGWVYMFGGSTYNAQTDTELPSNDIWISKDLGYTFTRQTLRAPWSMRISADAQTFHSTHLGVDVIYVADGDGGSVRYQNLNDLWVSSDAAKTWAKVATAPYRVRKDSELTITRDGLLIIAGGDDGPSNVNDLWASMDGGFTWGACCTKCGYETREDQMGILDSQGFYYLMGGDLAVDDDVSRYANDVWRSTFSFHDHAAVSQYCHVDVPSDGVGLRCWPGESCSSSAGTSGLSGAAIAGIVCAVLAVAVIGFLGWRYLGKRAAMGGGGLLASHGKTSDAVGSESFLGTDRL